MLASAEWLKGSARIADRKSVGVFTSNGASRHSAEHLDLAQTGRAPGPPTRCVCDYLLLQPCNQIRRRSLAPRRGHGRLVLGHQYRVQTRLVSICAHLRHIVTSA
jgi:hypothetical protein